MAQERETGADSLAPPANVVSPEEFLENVARLIVQWPLYRKYEFTGDFRKIKPHSSPPIYQLELPTVIPMDCARCVHRQPWDVSYPHKGMADLGFAVVGYFCRACRLKRNYWLCLTCDDTKGTIIKTGQYPPLELEPPPPVAAGMDKGDLALYRHALTCRNSNFGIAAVAYLRRIVENRTNFLIDLIAARLQEEDPSSPSLRGIEEIKEDRRFSEKIEFAAGLLPKSVRLGGQNPVTTLHELTSEALHGLSDEGGVDVFDRCQLAFEHVIKRLKQDQDEDQGYKDALKRLTKKAAKKNSPMKDVSSLNS